MGLRMPKEGTKTKVNQILHPKTEVISGIMEHECADILIDFFKKKR
jgi:tRNA(adenine34) deaminase